jgi:iron complex transport system permease protein
VSAPTLAPRTPGTLEPGTVALPGRTIRTRRLSLRLHPRAALVTGALLALTLGIAVLSLTTGDFPVPAGDVLRSLTGRGDTGTDFIVLTLRLPRVLAAVLVGAALGLSGAIFQNLTRNPLGSPDFIGLTAGASTGALVMILLLHAGAGTIAVGALIGCALTATAMHLLARGGTQGFRLVLIGIGIGAMLDAFNSFLITRARLGEAIGAQRWLIGSLNGRGWSDVVPVAGAMVVLVPLALLCGRRLALLSLGDETASALGVPVARTRLALFAVSVGLAAVATAAAGPIGFVALAAPQLARRLTGTAGSGLAAAATMGAFLLTLGDWAAQRVLPSAQLPVGIATGAVGGVYLCWLLVSEWRRNA